MTPAALQSARQTAPAAVHSAPNTSPIRAHKARSSSPMALPSGWSTSNCPPNTCSHIQLPTEARPSPQTRTNVATCSEAAAHARPSAWQDGTNTRSRDHCAAAAIPSPSGLMTSRWAASAASRTATPARMAPSRAARASGVSAVCSHAASSRALAPSHVTDVRTPSVSAKSASTRQLHIASHAAVTRRANAGPQSTQKKVPRARRHGLRHSLPRWTRPSTTLSDALRSGVSST
mmetsp:Transcript_33823/g.112863  ORF Transcript_33823/g.112863 Transcript_33823/m.112863 type:complete len:233 (-) Transcript_33823:394-1092(-)